MPVLCYRVIEYDYRPADAPPVLRVVCTTSPGTTSIRQVIRSTFPGVELAEPSGGLLAMFSDQEDILLGGNLPPEDEMERLLGLMTRVLTVQDACDISHCLDFYRYPEETDQSPEEWPYTPTGGRLKQAKYKGIRSAAAVLEDALVDFVTGHPGLARCDAVAAMPRSTQHGDRPDWPPLWASAIADALGAKRVALQRTRPTRPQKDIEDLEERTRNQRGSMVADTTASGRSVLVVDDLYMQGDSMEEAARALRESGATSVFGLCIAKTVKGCRAYPF